MNLEKKKFLSSYLLQQAKINRLYEMLEQVKFCDEFIFKEIENCKRRRSEIEKSIDDVEDERLGEILSQKYLCGKTLEEIALSLNYSKRHVERLHIAALKCLKLPKPNENDI